MTKGKLAKINGEMLIIHEEQILKFQNEIERRVVNDECSYLEAISHYCDEQDIDFESVRNLMSVPLLEKLKQEVYNARLAKGEVSNTLFGV